MSSKANRGTGGTHWDWATSLMPHHLRVRHIDDVELGSVQRNPFGVDSVLHEPQALGLDEAFHSSAGREGHQEGI